jgi:hypothetical protein
MTANEKIPWKRLSVEVAAIVGSILLAFAIDAWWDDRKDSNLEQKILADLLLEFEQDVELLRNASEWYELLYLDARDLLHYLDDDTEEIDHAEFERLVQSLWLNKSTHLETGAYDALLVAGELSLVSDEELRSHLAAWPSYVAEWAEEEIGLFQYAKNWLRPYTSSKIRERAIAPDFHPFPHGQSPPLPMRGALETNALVELSASIEFENLVYVRAQTAWHAWRDCETLISRVTELIKLIEKNLDG